MKDFSSSRLVRAMCAGAAVALLAACAAGVQAPARAEYFLSLQDGRAGLSDGAPQVRNAADTLAVVELSGGGLRVVQQLAMPTSLVGPPSSIAVAPGGRMALVTASTRRDPSNEGKVVPYDLVSVVALDPAGLVQPRVVASLHKGAGAAGVSINRAGTLALVANRIEGSTSVLAIDAQEVRVVDKVALGEKLGPAHVAFTPDGRHALISRDDNRISMLAIDGDRPSR